MNRDSGLTLVEVMIAMLITLVVIAGSIAFVARGRAAHRTSESLAQLEESLDAGFALLVDEIRLAGYLGLAPPASPVVGATAIGAAERADLAVAGSCGNSLAHDLQFALAIADAAYEAAPGVPIRCRPSPAGRRTPQSDTLVVRHAAAVPARSQAGRLQLETSLRTAILSASGIGNLGADARWHDLEVGVYYISADSTGRSGWPSLRRKRRHELPRRSARRPAFRERERHQQQERFFRGGPIDPGRVARHDFRPGAGGADEQQRTVGAEQPHDARQLAGGHKAGVGNQRLNRAHAELARHRIEIEHRHRVVAGSIQPLDKSGALAGNWTRDADADSARHSQNDGLQAGCRRFVTRVPHEGSSRGFLTKVRPDDSEGAGPEA